MVFSKFRVARVIVMIDNDNLCCNKSDPQIMAESDYDRIRMAIRYIVSQARQQPTLKEIAASIGLSEWHFQRLFSQWTGVSPKRFLQIITIQHAKQALKESASVLDSAYHAGLTSGSRLYDHFVTLEAVTPGEFRKQGEGMEIYWGCHQTPFGEAFIAETGKGVHRLSFLDYSDRNNLLQGLAQQWANASIINEQDRTGETLSRLFTNVSGIDKPLSLHVRGSNFQINVWKALLQIPAGMLTSYSKVAQQLGKPNAARAVGTAIGANPVAFLIPCHRVIRETGELGGYHWGTTRMHAIHAWETARYRDSNK